MENRQATRVGRPGDTILNKIEKVAKGENWSVVVECRDFEGKPLADPEDVDFIVTIGENERDENPFIELHTWDPQIALLDPAKASFIASFKRSDQILMAEGVQYFINYWTEPKDKSLEGRMLQARDAIRLLPSVEPKFVSSGRLAAVGFPSLLGSTSLTPYEIDPRDGFSGGKAPVGYVSTIDGVTLAIEGTLSLDRDQLVDRDITVTAFDGRGDVRSTIFHQTTYEALSFVGLASVEADRQDGGTVTVALTDGWTGGYGGRTYTATAGTISGSNLILPISDAGATTITLTATDEDGNTVPGSLHLTVEEVAPVIVAPTAAGALADLTLTEGVAMEPVDLSGDFTNGGGTLAFALAPTSGALPVGLSLSSAGVLSGTPTATVSGATIVVRATNEAGFADSAFSLTVNAAADAFQNIEGRVSTGNGQIFAEPTADAEPDEMSLLGFFMAPAAGFGAQVVPWFTSADGTHEAYIVVTSSGGIYASIYAIVDGVPQTPQIIQSSAHLIQPGQVFALGARGRAGGTFEIYQSIAGAPFVSIGSAQLPTGSVLPFYGEQKVFFGTNIVLEGLYLFDAVPAAFEDLASLNAARSSLMLANGRRAPIDSIKAAVGTPVYVIHGPAATITNNPGTAGGTYPIVGTITDYVPAVYQSDIVLSASGYVSGGGGGTNERTATMAMLLFVAYPDDPISLNSTFSIKSAGGDGSSSIQIISDGNTQVVVRGQDAVGGPISPASNAVASGLDTDPVLPGEKQAFLLRAGNGKVLVDRARDGGDFAPMMDINIPVDATFNVGGSTWQFGENTGSGNKRQEISGAFVFGGPSLPTATLAEIKAAIMASDGTMTDDVASIEAMFGPARVAAYGPAADWIAKKNKGTGTDFTGGNSAFTDVARPVEDPIPANAELLSRLSIQPHRDTTELMEGEVIDWRIAGLTEDEFKRYAIYWNFDDEGETGWNPELDIMPGLLRNPVMRTFPVGPQIPYGYRTSGTKQIVVNIVPPIWSGEEGCQLTFEQPVMALSDRYNASNTWVVVPSGGTDPTGIAGTRVTTPGAAWAAAKSTTSGTALIYLPGEVETKFLSTDSTSYGKNSAHLYLASYGTGKAKVDCSEKGIEFVFSGGAGGPKTFVTRNIHFDGGWDPVTAAGANIIPITVSYGRTHISLIDSRFSNARQGLNLTHDVTVEMDFTKYSFMAMDTQFWNCLDYGVYISNADDVGFAGCTAFWEPDMPMTKDGKNNPPTWGQKDYGLHGLGRVARAKNVSIYNVAGAVHHGWSGATHVNSTIDANNSGGATQPLFRIAATELKANSRVYIGRCYSDGQLVTLDAGATGGKEGPGCFAYQSSYTITGAANISALYFGHSGVDFSNSFIVMPNVPRELAEKYVPFRMGNSSDGEVTAGLQDKPIVFSRNAVLFMLNDANAPSVTAEELTGESIAQGLTVPIPRIVDGAMVYAPNRTITGVSTAAVATTPWGPQSRKIGQFIEFNDETIFSDPQHATPANAAIIAEYNSPPTLAPAAHTSAWDFWGELRPEVPTDSPIEANPRTGAFGPWVAPDKSPSPEAVV